MTTPFTHMSYFTNTVTKGMNGTITATDGPYKRRSTGRISRHQHRDRAMNGGQAMAAARLAVYSTAAAPTTLFGTNFESQRLRTMRFSCHTASILDTVEAFTASAASSASRHAARCGNFSM